MKPYHEQKIVILGMGYLMEYIYPCYVRFCGEGIGKNILAVTADEQDLPRKKEKFPFPVQLNDGLEALRTHAPDLILLAPPPSVAPQIIDEVLVPYYREVREKDGALPIIFAFPPTPVGRVYLEKLGADVRVANLLPNMVSEIGGLDVSQLGLTYVTYPDEGRWQDEEQEMLRSFFQPMGGTIEVAPGQLMEMLAGTVLVHNISQVIFAIADGMEDGGHSVSYRDIASSMRASHRALRGYHSGDTPCDRYTLTPYLAALCEQVVDHWFRGIEKFYLDSGLDQQSAYQIAASLLDLHLLIHQLEEREEIEQSQWQHATKGGVLEKGISLFDSLMKTEIKRQFYGYPAVRLNDGWLDWLDRTLAQLLQIVTEHGRRLDTGRQMQPFAIANHAVAFGLLAKHCLNSGIAGAEECLTIGVIRYARQRGNRMRQRCLRFGDPLTMLSYKAYCEWRPESEVMTVVTKQNSPVNKTEVTDCHWVNDWKKYGLLEYGKYYCDYGDYNLVKGFSDDLMVEMSKIFSRGADCCAFTWCGADLTEENQAWLNKRRGELIDQVTMDWEYHTAHLYHTITEALEEGLGAGSREIIRGMRQEYASLFTTEALAVIDGWKKHDFNIALYPAEGIGRAE